jgi:hypothetical protein
VLGEIVDDLAIAVDKKIFTFLASHRELADT